MRLELHILRIRDVQFGEKTELRDGVLSVDRFELSGLLRQDRRLGRVDIELARPGESCRILKVSDVIEPRAKKSGGGHFPGVFGQGPAGLGITCALRGLAVLMSDDSEGIEMSRDPNGQIVDMSGPAAGLGFYGQTHNVVVLPYPAEGVGKNGYRLALKLAELKAAVYLAEACVDLQPDEVEVYELPPLPEVSRGLEALPRVAYIFQIFSAQFQQVAGEPILYGGGVDRLVPMALHPNEVLDGALVNPYWGMGIETYQIQNHPVIKELYRRHGKDLCFVGVILTIAHNNELEGERSATLAANLAKHVLGADGVILTKSGGGAPEVEMARVAGRCEEAGVRTALALWELAADGNPESCVTFNLENVDALVSMGTPMITTTLPEVERVIGKPADPPGVPPINGQHERLIRWIRGALGQLGSSRLRTSRF